MYQNLQNIAPVNCKTHLVFTDFYQSAIKIIFILQNYVLWLFLSLTLSENKVECCFQQVLLEQCTLFGQN